MVRDLVESAIDMVRTERETEVEDLAHEKVDERLLDLLLPVPPDDEAAGGASRAASRRPPGAIDATGVFVVSAAGDGVKQEHGPTRAKERYKRTRDKLKQLLLDGQLEEREVEIEVTQQRRRCST